MDDSDIVITGISGRFPGCENILEFKEALLNGVDLITTDNGRFPPGIYGIPRRFGQLKDVESFDAGFFGMSPKQVDLCDPRHRMLIETAFEAIVDAGINPRELAGTKTGVYVGITSLDSSDGFKNQPNSGGYTNIGLANCMAANRISYTFDFKGPSYVLDTACSSGLYALSNASAALKAGEIDNAVVAGAQLNLDAYTFSEFVKLNLLSPDGKCRTFSADRDGYARSEAVVTILLQRKSKCRRMYATVIAAKTNVDGRKVEGVAFPSSVMQHQLMKELYDETGIDVNDIAYLEAHGTGTQVGDIQECQALVDFFGKSRTSPLKIGTVKSNMGHAEICSALCGVAKLLIAMEYGTIPGNLHFKEPAMDIPGVCDGQLQVVSKNEPFTDGLMAINAFGIGGANAHVILSPNPKQKINSTSCNSSKLVQVSGRTMEAVNYMLDEIEKNKDDEEFLLLLNEIYKYNIEGHNYRGYSVLGEIPKREVIKSPKDKRPIWFIYSGGGSQWPSMGKDLMRVEVFRNAIKRCAKALKEYNVDLEEIVVNGTDEMLSDEINFCSSVVAVEVALTDVLYSLNIRPDGIAGHSLGEVCCGYADGSLELEQAVLVGYGKGYACKSVDLPKGKMAALGLSKEECRKRLPNDVEIACYNSSSNLTISGPVESVIKTVEKLQNEGIFARTAKVGNYAFHSKYIAKAGTAFLQFLKKVIMKPKRRSEIWYSTSYLESEWNSGMCQYNSPEYHVYNFLNTVKFDQIMKYIPSNAIVIEVAPLGILQSILRKALGPDITNISLMDSKNPNNEQFFYTSIGKIYINGGQPQLTGLNPKVAYPVARGTMSISSLIKWDHSAKWFVPFFKPNYGFGNTVVINISDEEYSFISGHVVDGRVVLPATGYIVMVWKTLADMYCTELDNFPIIFQNVRFKRLTVLTPNQDVKFLVNVMKESENFEVFEGMSLIASGNVLIPKDVSKEFINPKHPKLSDDGYLQLNTQDIYKDLRLKGFHFSSYFQSIINSDAHMSRALLKWCGNWTTFLDSMLQLNVLSEDIHGLRVPNVIQKLIIDPQRHLEVVRIHNKEVPAFFNKNVGASKSGGIEIINVETSIPRQRSKQTSEPFLETYEYIPFENDTKEFSIQTSICIALQIIAENNNGDRNIKICQVQSDSTDLMSTVTEIMNKVLLSSLQLCSFASTDFNGNVDLILIDGEVDGSFKIDSIYKKLRSNGFVLYKGMTPTLLTSEMKLVYRSDYNNVYLYRNINQIQNNVIVIKVDTFDLAWIEKTKAAMKNKDHDVIYLLSTDELCGINGLVNCLNREPGAEKFKMIFIQDEKADKFSLDSDFYKLQLSKQLSFNVLKGGIWGSYKYLPFMYTEERLVENAYCDVEFPGDLSSIKWIEGPQSNDDMKENMCYVYYSALNFRDVLLAMANIQGNNRFNENLALIGFEYSGINTDGKRIMGIIKGSGIGTQIVSNPNTIWSVPENWSLEDAATVPVVYASSYYALVIRGRIQHAETILIHNGAGGVGLASIYIALSLGCTIFTTAGTQEKRAYIKKLFPQINESYIGNSRDNSFEEMVMEHTNGKGVDLVLNSLAGDLFQASLRCVATLGRFLEIGKMDLMSGGNIGSKMFLKNCTFHGVQIDDLFFSPLNTSLREKIMNLVSDGIRLGVVKPLPRIVFSEVEVEDAFRFLTTGKNIGKVLIRLREEKKNNKFPQRLTIKAQPRVNINSEKVYIIIGGLGGFGLELANWLIQRGAAKIILNSRRNISKGYQSLCLKKWRDLGCQIEVNTADTSIINGAGDLVLTARKVGKVGGIFNTALVLRESVFENQTAENFEDVFKCKIKSCQSMDLVTRKYCPDLDYFVIFSSLVSGRGSPGLTNYGMANSGMEQICLKRKSDGLPALAVQWGPIADTGYFEDHKTMNSLASHGIMLQDLTSCFATLEKFMLNQVAVGASTVITDNFFDDTNASHSKSAVELVAHIMGIRNIEQIDDTSTLSELGLDSLMIAEIKQTLYRNYNVEMDIEEIQLSSLRSLKQLTPENIDVPQKKIFSPIEPIIVLKKANNSTNAFLVPSLEANFKCIMTLIGLINSAVYGLQFTNGGNFNTVLDYASWFLTKVKEVQNAGPYRICGYKYGCDVAFEIALQLEEEGQMVQTIFIDGSPTFAKEFFAERFLKSEVNEHMQTEMMRYFCGLLLEDAQLDKVSMCLKETTNWETKLHKVCKIVAEQTGYEEEDILDSAKGFIQRCQVAYSYKPMRKLKGKITLLRPSMQQANAGYDYGLKEMCDQQVEIYEMDGDHLSLLGGENVIQVADIINRSFLDF